MAEERGFRNSSSYGVENKLKAIKLTARLIEKERVTVVDLGMNERRGDGLSSEIVESVPDSTKVTKMDRKPDLNTDEICSEKVSDESKITPRLVKLKVNFEIYIADRKATTSI